MKLSSIGIALALTASLGCGDNGAFITSSSPVSGAYELVVTSNVTGSTTLVETNLMANGTQSAASGPSQAQILAFENKTWYVNGICVGSTPGQNSVNIGVSSDHNVSLTLNDGGNSIAGQGSLTGTTLSGSYSVSGSSCPDLTGILGFPNGYDSGGFVGNPVPSLSGTFAGALNLPQGVENVVLTLHENADSSLIA